MPGLNKNSYFSSKTESKKFQNNKKSLRSFYKKNINSLAASLKIQKQKQIVAFLNQLPFWKQAAYIAGYQALKDEPCLSPFYKLWKNKVCFPVIKDSVLEFYKPAGRWQKNSFSILEPIAKPKNKIELSEISVFIVPGRVFDRRGGRLGRGKGFYDKTLAMIDHKAFFSKEKNNPLARILNFAQGGQVLFIGVAFSEQIHNEKLPVLKHDILMDVLITDRFVLKPVMQEKKAIQV